MSVPALRAPGAPVSGPSSAWSPRGSPWSRPSQATQTCLSADSSRPGRRLCTSRESDSPSCPAAPRHSQGSHGPQSSARRWAGAHPHLGGSQGRVTKSPDGQGQGWGAKEEAAARRDRGLASPAAPAARGQQAGQRAAAGSRQAGQKQHSKHAAWRSWPGQDQGPGAPDAPHPTQPPGLEASIRRLSPGVPSRSGRGSGRLVSPPAPGTPTCFSVMAYRYRRSGLSTRSRRMGLPSWATTLS